MSERSIAEIIGDRPTFVTDAGATYLGKPTVDDLLAWLLRAADTQDGVDFAAYWSTEIVEDFPARTYSVHVTIADENGDPRASSSSGPTFLAALEAAVRAVADRGQG